MFSSNKNKTALHCGKERAGTPCTLHPEDPVNSVHQLKSPPFHATGVLVGTGVFVCTSVCKIYIHKYICVCEQSICSCTSTHFPPLVLFTSLSKIEYRGTSVCRREMHILREEIQNSNTPGIFL